MLRLLVGIIIIFPRISIFADDAKVAKTNQQVHIAASSTPREIGLEEMRKVAAMAKKKIDAFHDGHRSNTNVLRIVYFHAKDSEPLPQWQERLNRAIEDVSNFYRDGMTRFGFSSKGLPLERKDNRVEFHLVRGTDPANRYDYDSDEKTISDLREAMKGKIEVNNEYVLMLYGLCRKEPDGRYVFHAPYYGNGNSRSGICHAADCELLDTQNFTQTKQRIVYTEHYYPRVEQTVAKFNSWYIGGIAHELGHGLGLSHNAGTPGEPPMGNISLMSVGNLHYRENLWGGAEPAFLSFASALQIASHPLFTGSNRDRWKLAKPELNLQWEPEAGALTISGKIAAEVEPYAAILYLQRKDAKSDHYWLTFPALVNDGSFKLQIAGIPAGTYRVELATCHVNGETTRFRPPFEIVADEQRAGQ